MNPTSKLVVDQEKGIVRITLEGRQSPRTIVAAVSSIACLPGMHRLWDIRKADLRGLDFTAVVGMTDDMASLPPVDSNIKIAILAGRDVEFGLSHMYAVLIEGKSPGAHRVFRSLEEAEAWLTEPTAD